MPGTTTLVAGRVEASIHVEAYAGIEFLPDWSPEPVEIDAESDHQVIGGVITAREPGPTLFVHDEFEPTDVAENWSIDIKGNGEVRGGPSLVVAAGELTDDGLFLDGVLIEYESETGNLRFRTSASSPLTTFELKSRSARFQGETPDVIKDNVFNLFRPQKLFVLVFSGAREVNFGSVLPKGLSRAELESDLMFDGSYGIGGTPSKVVFSIDGDISLATAERDLFDRWFHLNEIVATGNLGSIVGETIAVDYQWDAERFLTPLLRRFQVTASIAVILDGKRVATRSLEPCEELCRVEIALPIEYHDVSTERSIGLSVRNKSVNTQVLVHDVRMLGKPVDAIQSFEISVHSGQNLKVSADTSAAVRLFDSDGQHVTNSNFFTLPSPNEGVEKYRFEIRADRWDSYFLSIDWRPSAPMYRRDNRLLARVEDNGVALEWQYPVDLRTCAIEDFSWDGPNLEAIELQNYVGRYRRAEMRVPVDGIVENGYYSFDVRDGACVDLLTRQPSVTNTTIDFVPPELVDVPIQSTEWMRTGDGIVVLRFNESINMGPPKRSHVLTTRPSNVRLKTGDGALLDPPDTPLGLFSRRPMAVGEFVVINLGELGRGEYVLELDVSVWDNSNTESPPIQLTLPFVVSDVPASRCGNEPLRHGSKRNGQSLRFRPAAINRAERFRARRFRDGTIRLERRRHD